MIKYKNFIIKKRNEQESELYSKDNKKITTFVTVRALKKLVDRFYNKELNEFEKKYIFKDYF